MKVQTVQIDSFKRFDQLEFSLVNEETSNISERFLILGKNGSGKTSVLQAIALTLHLACYSYASVETFPWMGFLPGRYSEWGRPHIELTVTFTDEELRATQEIAEEWDRSRSQEARLARPFVLPGNAKEVTLELTGTSIHAPSLEQLYQFRGREYLQQLVKTQRHLFPRFAELPGVFWFDQYRFLGTTSQDEFDMGSTGRLSFNTSVSGLRQYLNGWKLNQQSKSYVYDYLDELEKLYKRVFPSRYFFGIEPMDEGANLTTHDFYFLLSDGERTYDLEEMSAGEQAIFPILYEITRKRIANSIVLIDEVDLNLHPDIAQNFVSMLPKIGRNCQFILSTHSEAVNNIISAENTFSLSEVAI